MVTLRLKSGQLHARAAVAEKFWLISRNTEQYSTICLVVSALIVQSDGFACEDIMPEVLLVEDSPGDVRLMREALRDANPAAQLHVVADGAAAVAFLDRQGSYADSPRPDIILLDLNLPKMDGRQVLAHVKADASLKLIPTVILTTSADEADIRQSYQLHANCYLTKPVQLEMFESLVSEINSFWLKRAKLVPPKSSLADTVERLF
jgi:chemotaxis family two-component system response regulator Rcp1